MTTKRDESAQPIFVCTYGSLRRGMGNDWTNTNAGAELIGLGHTKNNHDLYSYGGGAFPSVSLQHSASEKPVRVEVYQTTEEGLTGPYDRLEGYYGGDHPHTFYNRSLVPVVMDSGEELECWIYHIDEEQPVRVEAGDWCVFKRGEDYYLGL